ncbi:MAG: hypothetical protein JWM20_47 [Patescibacteria group bacterium]|nr:hypothetical protein [Patescibacteria group bacterium]
MSKKQQQLPQKNPSIDEIFDELELQMEDELPENIPAITLGALKVLAGKYTPDDLKDPQKVIELISDIKSLYRVEKVAKKKEYYVERGKLKVRAGTKSVSTVRTITMRHLEMALGGEKTLSHEDIAAVIKNCMVSTFSTNSEMAIEIWKSCSAKLKYAICVTNLGETFDMNFLDILYDHEGQSGLKVSSSLVFRTFISAHSLNPPLSNDYSVRYVNLDYDTGEKLVRFLEFVPHDVVLDFLTNSADFKVWYLIAVEELKNYFAGNSISENGVEFLIAVRSGDLVPQELPFLKFLQEVYPEFFNELVSSIFNPLYDERRNSFYDQRTRQLANPSDMDTDMFPTLSSVKTRNSINLPDYAREHRLRELVVSGDLLRKFMDEQNETDGLLSGLIDAD